jgi:hypothetical protein
MSLGLVTIAMIANLRADDCNDGMKFNEPCLGLTGSPENEQHCNYTTKKECTDKAYNVINSYQVCRTVGNSYTHCTRTKIHILDPNNPDPDLAQLCTSSFVCSWDNDLDECVAGLILKTYQDKYIVAEVLCTYSN